MDSEGTGTGKISKGDESGICTGYDKLREMTNVIAHESTSQPFRTVYIGDSNTDLPCLLHADIGVIMGKTATLIETCKRVGLKVMSHKSFHEIGRKESGQDLTLYQFNDWNGLLESGLFE